MQQAPQYAQYAYPGVNMGPAPAVYANPALQPPAQMFTSGVPGAPPTITVPTDISTMANYALPQGPRPKKAFTLKKRTGPVSFGGEGGGEERVDTQGGGANITVTVNKLG